jgi:uncharacterized protein (DUF58 family)
MTHPKKQGWYRITHHPKFKRFFQGTGEQKEPYLTNGRNVYILPTKSGIAFALILLVMLIGAINYNNSLGYMFTFFLASLSIVTILHTYKNILRLEFLIGKPQSVFSGENTLVPVYINQTQSINRYSLSLLFDQPSFCKHTQCDITSKNNKFFLTLLTNTRGLCEVPRFTLHSTFPLGLFLSWSNIHLYQRFIVYPQPAKNVPDLPKGQYLPDQDGDQGKGTDDFSGLRNYHHGDSLRHIHWKAFAKQGTMITKQFGGDRCDETWLTWDALPDVDIETRLSILTRWVLNAELEGTAYGLKIPGLIIKPSSGILHREQCLKALALYGN